MGKQQLKQNTKELMNNPGALDDDEGPDVVSLERMAMKGESSNASTSMKIAENIKEYLDEKNGSSAGISLENDEDTKKDLDEKNINEQENTGSSAGTSLELKQNTKVLMNNPRTLDNDEDLDERNGDEKENKGYSAGISLENDEDTKNDLDEKNGNEKENKGSSASTFLENGENTKKDFDEKNGVEKENKGSIAGTSLENGENTKEDYDEKNGVEKENKGSNAGTSLENVWTSMVVMFMTVYSLLRDKLLVCLMGCLDWLSWMIKITFTCSSHMAPLRRQWKRWAEKQPAWARRMLQLLLFAAVLAILYYYYPRLGRGNNATDAPTTELQVWRGNMTTRIQRCILDRETEDAQVQSLFDRANSTTRIDNLNQYLYNAIKQVVALRILYEHPAANPLQPQEVSKNHVEKYFKFMLETMEGPEITPVQDPLAHFHKISENFYMMIVQTSIIQNNLVPKPIQDYPADGPTTPHHPADGPTMPHHPADGPTTPHDPPVGPTKPHHPAGPTMPYNPLVGPTKPHHPAGPTKPHHPADGPTTPYHPPVGPTTPHDPADVPTTPYHPPVGPTTPHHPARPTKPHHPADGPTTPYHPPAGPTKPHHPADVPTMPHHPPGPTMPYYPAQPDHPANGITTTPLPKTLEEAIIQIEMLRNQLGEKDKIIKQLTSDVHNCNLECDNKVAACRAKYKGCPESCKQEDAPDDNQV
ncbi:hypothetical protein ACP70R_048341 [Stipagrostis hirtigluma subsp. patula]